MEVEILLITYNRRLYTELALLSFINNSTDVDYVLHIVDNGSTEEGMVDMLRRVAEKSKGRVTLTLNKTNLGIARVTNKFWTESTAQYIGKIDNDTLVCKKTLWYCLDAVKCMNHPCVIAATHLFFHSHSVDQDVKEFKEHGLNEEVKVKNGVRYRDASWVGGCCYVMNRSCIGAVGPVEEGIGKVYGWTRWQIKAKEKGVIVGYTWPPKYVMHLDEPWNPLSLKDNEYKEYTKEIFNYRHNPGEDTNGND